MPLPPTLDPAPLTVTARPRRLDVETRADGVTGRVRAMACDVVVRVPGTPGAEIVDAVRQALRTFAEMEQACTRFAPDSPLMRANADGLGWARVPQLCFDALVEAHRAHLRTAGVFDPRVLTALVSLGYDASLVFGRDGASAAPGPTDAIPAVEPWRPRFRESDLCVQIGPRPVDLGGIGKGLAVRWAVEALSSTARDVLVDAGGDCWCGGRGPGGGPWMVGVEDPHGGEAPLAVLGLSDRACATSSVRVRRWRAGGTDVHHLIDPSRGGPGGDGLTAVTVVGNDAADAEVWAKVLFLAGRAGVAEHAVRHRLDALWVDADGAVGTSASMERHVVWRSW